MLIRNLLDLKEKVVADETILRELLNPTVDDLKLGYSLAFARVEPGKRSTWHNFTLFCGLMNNSCSIT